MDDAGEDVQAPASSAGASNKLFLGGLSWTTSEDTIRQHFGKYGDISEVIVMRDRITNKPRGFGFITFKEQASADEACKDAHVLDGRTIDAKPSLPHGEHSSPKSKKIFVGGLAPETTEDAFKQHFERFGKVVEAQIMVDHTSGRSRGFGFITFEDEASVAAVFSAGSMQELGGKKVEVKTATPKGSGPVGRGGLAAGRGLGLASAARGFMPGRFGDFPYGLGPAGYPLPAGYMPVPGYGGYMPYTFPGMMLGGYGGYAPYGAPYFAGPMGFPGGTLQQQQRAAAAGSSSQSQQRRQQQPAAAAAAVTAPQPLLQQQQQQQQQQQKGDLPLQAPGGEAQSQPQQQAAEAADLQPVQQQVQRPPAVDVAATAQQLAQLQLQQHGSLLPSAASLLPGQAASSPAGPSPSS